MNNPLYLRRRRRLSVREGSGTLPREILATAQKNLESLGFAFSEPLLNRLATLPLDQFVTQYKSVTKTLQQIVGAHRPHHPLYPDFPAQVMGLSEAELYLNAMFHYIAGARPEGSGELRPPLTERPPLRLIDLGSPEDFEQIFVRAVGSRTSISAEDKEDIGWFVSQYRDDIARLLPDTAPMRENLAVVGAALLRFTTIGADWLDTRIRTPTDVLRLAVAMSDGDVSLANPTKFVNFRRADRRRFLGWLERFGDPAEELMRWKERWKRLGERLHPGDYSEEFPRTYAAFRALRNDEEIDSLNRRVERSVAARDVDDAVRNLVQRPGVLARRLDHLLRISENPPSVVAAFADVSDQVSTPVLLQMLAHFRHRAESAELRTFFPKGEVANVFGIPNRLPELPTDVLAVLVESLERTLVSRFSALPPLGRCWVDAALKSYLVPFSQRSASKALRTVVRGSRLPMSSNPVVRFFLWWKNGSSRTDIDLSAAMFGASFNFVDALTYYNLKNYGGHHSGDIVDAPHGAAEFIDIDVERTVRKSVRYVVMSLNSFTQQPYCDLPECFAGWMGRTDAASGEVFEPSTVDQKVDIASNTRICLPAILDLHAREVIWTDVALNRCPRWNNVRNNLSGVSLLVRAFTNLRKPDLHSLFSLHARARGEPAAAPDAADTVFSVSDGITPFDLQRIASDFL